ncbi:TVP38/TMEM64 family protein [uncultured Enterovirga sp.]|uniref:TVP38/TMEM64 family protein n=1 Tax=uncultured Enterovirga sp. TaxID=2026352 RepID=UPI0035CAD462
MIRRFGPLLLLAIPLVASLAAYLVAGSELWQPDAILARRDALKGVVEAQPLLSLVLFMAVYFAIISSALPVGPPMSLIAGFLFGRWVGTPAILLAATAGAVVVFGLARLSAQTSLADRVRARLGPIYETISADLRRNAFGYLLAMRLVPVFPFFAVNVAAGLFGLPLRTFVLATLIGRMPGTFVYVSLGEEIGRVTSIADLASPRIYATLTALGIVALVPIAVAGWRRRRGARDRRM